MRGASQKAGCIYCLKPGAGVVRVSNYKHHWFMCKSCGTMRRENKQAYPADRLIRLLSRTTIGRKIANRLFPLFMRRANAEQGIYADYGRAFHAVFAGPIDNAFLEMKRQRYLREPDQIISLFRSHGTELCDKSVLDVSGGPGSFAHLIRKSLKEIVVTEYAGASVRSMQENLPGIRVFEADVNEPWTDTQSFDVVLYRSCLYFCRDLRAHLAQIRERIAAGGYIYISTNPPTLGNALRWQYEDYTLDVLYHPDTVKDALVSNGFSIVDSGQTSFYAHFLEWYTGRDKLYHLWGIWHLLSWGGPRGTDARSAWVLARKQP